MDDWKPISDVIPPSPSHTKIATFTGRADDETGWAFYCRDGTTVIGPRPLDEILAFIYLDGLSDDNLIFIVGTERWISVADFLRTIEDKSPGTIDLCYQIRSLFLGHQSSATQASNEEDEDWVQTGVNLSMVSPHIGGAYLGYKAVKKFSKWIKDSDGESA
jgi:hypothetical protein